MTAAQPAAAGGRRTGGLHSLKAPAIVALLTLAHAAAIVVFSKGFLLNRVELPQRSSCSDYASGWRMAESGKGDATTSSGSCVTAPFDRTVLLVLDALRYDFVLPSASGAPFPTTSMPKLLALLGEAVGGWPGPRFGGR